MTDDRDAMDLVLCCSLLPLNRLERGLLYEVVESTEDVEFVGELLLKGR